VPSPKHRNMHSFVLFHAASRNLAVAAEIVQRDADYDRKRKRQLLQLLDEARQFAANVDHFARASHSQPTISQAEIRGAALHGIDLDLID
jgi:hypothetical protein